MAARDHKFMNTSLQKEFGNLKTLQRVLWDLMVLWKIEHSYLLFALCILIHVLEIKALRLSLLSNKSSLLATSQYLTALGCIQRRQTKLISKISLSLGFFTIFPPFWRSQISSFFFPEVITSHKDKLCWTWPSTHKIRTFLTSDKTLACQMPWNLKLLRPLYSGAFCFSEFSV